MAVLRRVPDTHASVTPLRGIFRTALIARLPGGAQTAMLRGNESNSRGLRLTPFGNSLIENRPKSGCVASPLDGAGNRISRGPSQHARAPLRHPTPDSARPMRFPAAR
jgi:hypothetical protein